MPVRVKICCISNVAEARLAVECGASALGLVSAMPSGPGVIHDDLIAEIAAMIPPGIGSFLLTCAEDVDAIIEQQQRARVNTLQLVDRLPAGSHRRLRQELPGISLVQVIHVTGEASIAEAIEIAPEVDAILLDSGNPSLAVKELGGTGRVHNWEISRQIRDAISKPLFLAGGLNSENVAKAISVVRPYGVDICGGVRTNGDLDKEKLRVFLHEVSSVS